MGRWDDPENHMEQTSEAFQTAAWQVAFSPCRPVSSLYFPKAGGSWIDYMMKQTDAAVYLVQLSGWSYKSLVSMVSLSATVERPCCLAKTSSWTNQKKPQSQSAASLEPDSHVVLFLYTGVSFHTRLEPSHQVLNDHSSITTRCQSGWWPRPAHI